MPKLPEFQSVYGVDFSGAKEAGRNRVLEVEIEILKRGSAYFARENVLPNVSES